MTGATTGVIILIVLLVVSASLVWLFCVRMDHDDSVTIARPTRPPRAITMDRLPGENEWQRQPDAQGPLGLPPDLELGTRLPWTYPNPPYPDAVAVVQPSEQDNPSSERNNEIDSDPTENTASRSTKKQKPRKPILKKKKNVRFERRRASNRPRRDTDSQRRRDRRERSGSRQRRDSRQRIQARRREHPRSRAVTTMNWNPDWEMWIADSVPRRLSRRR